MAWPAGRVVIHNFARRAILDALAPADRLLDVGRGGGLLLRDNSDDHRRTYRRTHDTIQSLEDTLRERNTAVFASLLRIQLRRWSAKHENTKRLRFGRRAGLSRAAPVASASRGMKLLVGG